MTDELARLAEVAGRDVLTDDRGVRYYLDDQGRRIDEHLISAPLYAFDKEQPQAPVSRPFVPALLDLTKPPPLPTTLHRFIYAGGLTTLQGEPGAGKSWLAEWIAGQVVEGGRAVIYMDEEGGSDLTTERLVALGVEAEAVRSRLRYFPFEGRRWDADDLAALDQLIGFLPNAALAVLDSLPDFLSAAGRSEDNAGDVTEFVNVVIRRFLRAGIAVLVLDHLRKPDQEPKRRTRSRYARGSGAKLAKADATLLLEAAMPFDATTNGRLRLWKTKDRRGRLDLPWITADALELDVTVDDGNVTITESESERVSGREWSGPTECMAAVLAVLTVAAPEELTGRKLEERMRAAGHPFRRATITEAAERLALEGAITVRNGPRASRLFRWQETDNTRDAVLDEDF